MRRSPDDILDEWLVLRSQGGEADALRELVERWQPRLLRLAGRLSGKRDSARDIAQDAWLAIVRGLQRLDDPARFRAWACAIVANRCADWVRRRAVRRNAMHAMQSTAAVTGPVDEASDDVSRLRSALRRLPAEQRRLLALHHLDGLGVSEIATVLRVPVGTVKSRLHAARESLRQTMGESHDVRSGPENS